MNSGFELLHELNKQSVMAKIYMGLILMMSKLWVKNTYTNMAIFLYETKLLVDYFLLFLFLNAKLDFMIANKLSNNHNKEVFREKTLREGLK